MRRRRRACARPGRRAQGQPHPAAMAAAVALRRPSSCGRRHRRCRRPRPAPPPPSACGRPRRRRQWRRAWPCAGGCCQRAQEPLRLRGWKPPLPQRAARAGAAAWLRHLLAGRGGGRAAAAALAGVPAAAVAAVARCLARLVPRAAVRWRRREAARLLGRLWAAACWRWPAAGQLSPRCLGRGRRRWQAMAAQG